METENKELIGKQVDVQMRDFHLYGILTQLTPQGIWLKTKEQESYIGWPNIIMIRLDRRYKGD